MNIDHKCIANVYAWFKILKKYNLKFKQWKDYCSITKI